MAIEPWATGLGPIVRTDTPLTGPAAAEHLLRVACGLDSAILGDGQILGQVRQAYATARAARSTGPLLNRLFETALRAGKRARHETGLGRGATTTASAAVEMVARLAGPLAERHVLVVGAGETAKLAALHLARLRPAHLIIANRTLAHAEAIAARVGGTAIDLTGLPPRCARRRRRLRDQPAGRRHLSRPAAAGDGGAAGRPLLAVDLAMPRDIEALAGLVPGVTLLDLDRVQADASTNLARDIVGAAGRDDRRGGGARLRGVATRRRRRRRHPCACAHGRRRARRALERSRRSDLDHDALDRQTQLLMNRLLHPTVLRLKTLAGTADGEARLALWRSHLEARGARYS